MSTEEIDFYYHYADQLKKLLNVNQLKLDHFIEHVNNEHLVMLLQNITATKKLLDLGFAIQHLGLLEINKLKTYLKHVQDMEIALQYVTHDQLLGISHQPPQLDPIKRQLKQAKKSTDTRLLGDYSYQAIASTDKNNNERFQLTITYEKARITKKPMLTIIASRLSEAEINELDKLIHNIMPTQFIHNWYTIEIDTDNRDIFYSKETNSVMIEECDVAFPMNDFTKKHSVILSDIPFYRECRLMQLLEENGCPIEQYRKLPGITAKKLDVLCDHLDEVKLILDKGISITDFAFVRENRLITILANFTDAEKVLKFVDIYELVGLYYHLPNKYSPTMFQSVTSKSRLGNQTPNNELPCQIV